MYSNWIPQNLQKRVFLYILQQLSLFSGIDLPNLEEVSLGNIHLRDVSLDPEKITKIPGLRLRHGNLRSVALKGSVKDGAHLEIAGVDLVVAPSIDNLHEDIENAQASLAQSSADLTSTILLDSPLSPGSSPRGSGENSPASPFSTPKEPSNSFSSPASRSPPPSTSEKDLPRDLPQPPPSTRSKDSSDTTRPRASSSESARRPSSLGGVMSRAIDIALSKLQIRISDINVKLIVEPGDASSPETQKNQPPSSETAPRSEDRSEDGVSEDSQSEESDDDMDYMADEPAEESLMDSMVFTHEEASSIYMSATSQTLPNPQNKDTVPSSEEADIVPLFYIDYIDVSFQNVSPLSNVRVDIKNINVSAVPLLPTVSIVLNSLSKLFKLSIHQLRKRNSLNKPTPRPGVGSQVRPQPDVASESLDDSDESCLLERFHINRIEVSLTSALEESGSFASFEDEVNIVLANLTIKLKDENLTYGGLETFEILRYIHGEKKGPKKADIRFEYSKIIKQKETMASELTILISRPGYLKLDASSLKYLINLSLWISSVNENLDSFLKTLKQFNDISNTRSAGARDSHVPGPSSSQIIFKSHPLKSS
ncbi:hypothetical protein JCM33374_g3842 [Metschnikowia sp. JCM 33374]|nr:hypothetical protein JCM33374_g3842 [Metschnikowia sp. JCM 33374]